MCADRILCGQKMFIKYGNSEEIVPVVIFRSSKRLFMIVKVAKKRCLTTKGGVPPFFMIASFL